MCVDSFPEHNLTLVPPVYRHCRCCKVQLYSLIHPFETPKTPTFLVLFLTHLEDFPWLACSLFNGCSGFIKFFSCLEGTKSKVFGHYNKDHLGKNHNIWKYPNGHPLVFSYLLLQKSLSQ